MVTVASPTEEQTAFEDYLRFGNDEERPKGETSRAAYLWTIDLFRRFLDGREPTPDLGKEFLKMLEARGNRASSINRHIWALKSYFRFKGLEFRIRGLTTQERDPRYLLDEEWEHLVKTSEAPMYDPTLPDAARRRALLELALLYTYVGGGVRLSEATNLEVDAVFDEGYVRVMGKGGRERVVPVEAEVLAAIKNYLAVKGHNGRYVFSNKEGDGPMPPRTAQGIIKALCRRAGLNDVHIHSLRHTLGYMLTKAGVAERDVQAILGHRNIQTTKLYTHLRNEDLKRRLPKLFARARQGKLGLK